MSLIDRLRKEAPNGHVQPPNDEALAKACPLLWEMLTLDQYRDKSDRILPEVKIRRVGGGYEVVLQDHETCTQIGAVSLTWEGLPAALEAALGATSTVWRSFKSYVNPKGLRRHEDKKR